MSEIDVVAAALIEWVKAAHAAGHSLELLTPESLHWYTEAGGANAPSRLVLLPLDWGFRAGRGGKADFFADNSPGTRFLDLHLSPTDFFASHGKQLDRLRDWRTVARLLLWAICEVRGFSHDHADEDAGKSRPPAFETLRQVMAAKSASGDGLKEALGERGSGKTIGEALLTEGGGDELPPRRGRLWQVALAVVLLGATAGGLAWVFGTTDVPPAPYCAKCPKDSLLYPLLFEFEKAKDDPAAKYRVFEEMWKAKDASTGQRRAIEDECLDELLRTELLPPGGGLPQTPFAVAAAKPLAAVDECQKEAKRFADGYALQNPNDDPVSYADEKTLAAAVDQLGRWAAVPLSTVPDVRKREQEAFAAAVARLAAVFESSGRGFRAANSGIDFEARQRPAYQRFRKSWAAFQSLAPTPTPTQEVPPWLTELDERYK